MTTSIVYSKYRAMFLHDSSLRRGRVSPDLSGTAKMEMNFWLGIWLSKESNLKSPKRRRNYLMMISHFFKGLLLQLWLTLFIS